MVVYFGGASNCARVEKECKCRRFHRFGGVRFGAVRQPQDLQQKRSDHCVDVDAIDRSRHTAIEQRLYQHAVIVVKDVVLAATLLQVPEEDLSWIVIDRFVLEDGMIDAGYLPDFKAASRLFLRLVSCILFCAAPCEALEIHTVVRVRWISEICLVELIDQEGDAFVAVTSVDVATVREEPYQCLIELHPLRRLWSIRRHCTLRSLNADRTWAISGQQQPQKRLKCKEFVFSWLPRKQRAIGHFC